MTEVTTAEPEDEDDGPRPGEDPAVFLGRKLGALSSTLGDRYVTRREFNLRTVVLVVLVGLLLFQVFTNRGQINSLSKTNERLAATNEQLAGLVRDLRSTNDQLAECIGPAPASEQASDPHECYDRGQEAQADAIGQLIETFQAGTAEIIAEIQRQGAMP